MSEPTDESLHPDEPLPHPGGETPGGRVSYQLDWNEYWRARELCWRAATGTLFLRLVPATGLVGIVTGVVLVTLGIAPQFALFFWVFGIIFLSTRFFRYRTVRKQFRKRPAGTEVLIEWGAEGLHTVEGSGTETRIRWEDARIVLLTSAGFLLEARHGGGTWLPFSGFEGPEAIDRFEAEVRARQIPILDRSTVG